ncbi:MAG: NAD(P)/FAD-dependent oxidoreductase [Deltaproteobacteria bacterium]|nr:MAG: NAD(P)/FAD-dependent oxidoreductase [Deltaproteobacteria bacterium]
MSEKYWDKRGGEGPWDVIVIGSGIGGMTCAAMLAKWGYKVLVLEQHYTAGGFTHTFRRKQWTWDVGVHAVGEVGDRAMPGKLLKWLTDGRLTWTSLGAVYDAFHFPDGVDIDFPDNKRQFRDNLIAAFPDEVDAIDQYLGLVREVGQSMRGYYLSRIAPPGLRRLSRRMMAGPAEKWLQRRTADVLDELTDNEQLKTVLAAQWGYYGSVPSRSSFAMQALVVRHFWHGGFYPTGGSGEIATQLLKTVADAGGWTRIYADVQEILVENGKAVGVRMADGQEIRASRVVSAAGVMSTIQRLLPDDAKGAWSEQVEQLRPASAHVCLYLGFEGDITKAGAGSANQWFWNTWDAEADVWDIDADPIPDAPILYCSFPSLKDPHHDPGKKQLHTGEVVTFVPWSTFEPFLGTKWKKRGPEYDALKQKLHDKLLAQFLAKMPELAPMLKYAELSTPLSTEHFARPMRGSIYGIEPTPERFATDGLKPRSPISGLYFAGSEVSTVGVIGAMMGGVLAACAMEPVKGMQALRNL